MEIKTKYNIGQNGFLIQNTINGYEFFPTKTPIREIRIKPSYIEGGIKILYVLEESFGYLNSFYEEDFFLTSEEAQAECDRRSENDIIKL